MKDPGYGMALRTFAVLGTRVSCVRLDNEGLRVDQLPDKIRLVWSMSRPRTSSQWA